MQRDHCAPKTKAATVAIQNRYGRMEVHQGVNKGPGEEGGSVCVYFTHDTTRMQLETELCESDRDFMRQTEA